MSCHAIGEAMGFVAGEILREFDHGVIYTSAAIRLLAATKRGVNFCDGNEGEWEADFVRCRCGKCLKAIPKGEKMYRPYNRPDDMLFSSVCQNCYSKLPDNYKSDKDDKFVSNGDPGYP